MRLKPYYFVFVLAFILRLINIGSQSIWLDEAILIHRSVVENPQFYDANPPLYEYLLTPIVKISTSEFAVRFLSLFFGTCSVILIYFLGTKLFNKQIGIISSILLCLSYYHIYYSQESRSYSLLVFLSLLSMYYFIQYLYKPKKYLTHYFICTLLMLYSHYFAVLNVIVQNVFFIYKYKLKNKSWYAFQVILFGLYLPLLITLFNTQKILNNEPWRRGLIEFTFIEWNFSGLHLNTLFRLVLIYGIFIIFKNRNKFKTRIFDHILLLSSWLVIVVLLPLIYIIFFNPIFISRYILFAIIPYYLLISFSIYSFPKKMKIFVLLLIIIFSINNDIIYYKSSYRAPWKNISEYLSSFDYDIIILEPGYIIVPFSYYFLPTCFYRSDIYNCTANSNIYTIYNDIIQEKTYISNNEKVVYIKRDIYGKKNDTDFFKFLKDNYNCSVVKEFSTVTNVIITIYLFE